MNTFLYYLYWTKVRIMIAEAWIKFSIYCYHHSLDKDTLMLLANIEMCVRLCVSVHVYTVYNICTVDVIYMWECMCVYICVHLCFIFYCVLSFLFLFLLTISSKFFTVFTFIALCLPPSTLSMMVWRNKLTLNELSFTLNDWTFIEQTWRDLGPHLIRLETGNVHYNPQANSWLPLTLESLWSEWPLSFVLPPLMEEGRVFPPQGSIKCDHSFPLWPAALELTMFGPRHNIFNHDACCSKYASLLK